MVLWQCAGHTGDLVDFLITLEEHSRAGNLCFEHIAVNSPAAELPYSGGGISEPLSKIVGRCTKLLSLHLGWNGISSGSYYEQISAGISNNLRILSLHDYAIDDGTNSEQAQLDSSAFGRGSPPIPH
jgi:hypothetical protein